MTNDSTVALRARNCAAQCRLRDRTGIWGGGARAGMPVPRKGTGNERQARASEGVEWPVGTVRMA